MITPALTRLSEFYPGRSGGLQLQYILTERLRLNKYDQGTSRIGEQHRRDGPRVWYAGWQFFFLIEMAN